MTATAGGCLEAHGVTKRFHGLLALSDVSITVAAGEVVGVIGPNGAGKSTLLGALSGFVPIDRGAITCDGIRIDGRPADRIAAAGLVARTFQATRLMDLDGRSNVVVGAHRFGRRSLLRTMLSPRRRDENAEEAKLLERARAAWELLGLPDPVSITLEHADSGTLRLIQIARVLAVEPRVLLLDEPTAGLDRRGAAEVCGAIAALRGRGVAVGIVEHDLAVVQDTCDRVVVMDQGRVIAAGPPADVVREPAVAEIYAGQEGAWT